MSKGQQALQAVCLTDGLTGRSNIGRLTCEHDLCNVWQAGGVRDAPVCSRQRLQHRPLLIHCRLKGRKLLQDLRRA